MTREGCCCVRCECCRYTVVVLVWRTCCPKGRTSSKRQYNFYFYFYSLNTRFHLQDDVRATAAQVRLRECRRWQRLSGGQSALLRDAGFLRLPSRSSSVQDYDLFAVFDGHAGEKAAKFCAKHFPRIFSKRVTAAKETNSEFSLGDVLTSSCKRVNEKFLDV